MAGESLPDTAPGEDQGDADMTKRFSAEVMTLEELEAHFLASPIELDSEEETRGGSAVTDPRLIEESMQQQRERERERALQRVELPSRDVPPPPLPTYSPIRDL